MRMNSNIFDFSFFLSAKENVESLEQGAMKNGGATIYKDGSIYSNIKGDDFISTNNKENAISVFVPNTMDVNTVIDNTEYVEKCINMIKDRYNLSNLFIYTTKGSWYSEDNEKVVIEKITVLEVKLRLLNEVDIKYFIKIANMLKEDMRQEGVSLQINNSLAIV